MTKANRVHSTPPTNTPVDPTRRRILSQAAGIAAGGAALALAIPPARAADDPVFALIEAHRAADVALEATLAEKSRLEEAGQKYDDSLAEAAHEAEISALYDLVEAVPATLAGVIASMTYIVGLTDGSYGRLGDDEIVPLLANLAEALQGLAVQS
jgi:hypothetical protein